MMDYFSKKRRSQLPPEKGKGKEKSKSDTEPSNATTSQQHHQHHGPVLNDDDEAFLQRIVSEEGPAPPLPERPHEVSRSTDAQVVLMQGADRTPLPDAPDTPEGEVAKSIEGEAVQMAARDKERAMEERERKKKNRFSWLTRSASRASSKRADKAATGSSLQEAAQSLKVPEDKQLQRRGSGDSKSGASTASGEVATKKKEEDEIADVMEKLNLAAVNNSVFSISDESKDLLKKFNLVLRDLVNGVPTAYGDLESLLTNSDSQIQKTYKSLPPFLQELIEKLPEKVTGKLGPELLATGTAAAAVEEKDKKDKKKGKSEYLASGAAAAGKLLKVKVPSLKELLTKQGSVVALLRSVVAALRTRFPALMGLNALWSVALFVLLFIFWYCHKRGREVRLEKERLLTEKEMEDVRARVAADPAWVPPPGWADGTVTTRAPEGASVDEVHDGMFEDPLDLAAKEEEGRAGYAPEGSLAKAIKNEEVEKK